MRCPRLPLHHGGKRWRRHRCSLLSWGVESGPMCMYIWPRLKIIHEHLDCIAERLRRRRLKRALLTPAMTAAGANPLPSDTAALRSMTGLRRCVICTGLSVFKRSRRGAPNEQLNSAKEFGALRSPASALAPPDGSFTCYGQERLAYVHAPPADDARLDQPDVSFMWCLGKSVFLLQSGLPGLAHAPEKAGRS